jgi:hypothetical protein
MPRLNVHWQDASKSNYTAESITVNGYTLTVCLDDEGPIRPAFYWDITGPAGPHDKIDGGWMSTVAGCRRDGLEAFGRYV